MEYKGIILCGPPASGKNCITTALKEKNNRIILFKKYRGSTPVLHTKEDEYINISKEEFRKLLGHEIKSHLTAYNRRYGIGESLLTFCSNNQLIPVIHFGQMIEVEDFLKYRKASDYLKVLLIVPREVIEQRLNARHGEDQDEIDSRLEVADEFYNTTDTTENRKKFDYCLPNLILEDTVRTLLANFTATYSTYTSLDSESKYTYHNSKLMNIILSEYSAEDMQDFLADFKKTELI